LVLLGLLIFAVAGLFAFSRLNIEAYPNPAPVILEITAQSPGQSAEEMERYFTIPIEVGLAATPGDVFYTGLKPSRALFRRREH
jgi:cobalt-zinc-cadmium resistance protein CzcA